ncbi:MAG: phosphatidylserine decarboxylase family protein [Bacteroidales bacterium]|nr:phosphatidylserine decarboxylase family protein [Bacteroidales bacterium]MDT3356865.1 phosphatidylserine decarboxylase family protein [Bacteroidota bacterium]MEE3463215.1 phosphatidylserine decarboxylase family protein [Candidatus Cryptobacteroides sp.]SKC41654.1 phosphatidylserine decarboxylase [Bacteroidales bacterium WCE2008]MBO4816773.1 phosphatidylserine decarboxylase family protein [Bacteroidales bacterium]
MRFVIQKDCYGTILKAWLVAISCIALLLWLLDPGIIRTVLIVLLVVFMGFVTWFHRVPERKALGTGNLVTSVADGKVVVVEKVFEKEYLKKECIQVSVYMNFFDVHVNYWPIDGKVTYYKYHPGKYLLAFHPKASELNEHSSTALSNGKDEILFKQIAGTFARRIVCYSKEGNEVKAGDQCGVIKFGSRIDMYLPLDADIKVKLGDLTVASETVIAELK